jgi:predicted nucleic acid-binding Zn ribbon protein
MPTRKTRRSTPPAAALPSKVQGRKIQCIHCGIHFIPTRNDQRKCSRQCNLDYNNLAKGRARLVYERLYHWGLGGTRDLSAIRAQVKAWIEEDKKQGRPPP